MFDEIIKQTNFVSRFFLRFDSFDSYLDSANLPV